MVTSTSLQRTSVEVLQFIVLGTLFYCACETVLYLELHRGRGRIQKEEAPLLGRAIRLEDVQLEVCIQ
jgi:hypothetical protein